jgi:hypothetical protein
MLEHCLSPLQQTVDADAGTRWLRAARTGR